MSELSTHPCPRCNVGLYIEVNDEVDGVDLLICKQCWGVGVAAKSIELVISKKLQLAYYGGLLGLLIGEYSHENWPTYTPPSQ